jgi:phage/plasmid-associated DNA primase
MPEPIKKPTQPPSSFSADALVKALNEARAKVGLSAHVSALPAWKRWVGGEREYDTSGLRDVLNTYGYAIDDIKSHLDAFDEREATHYRELKAAVEGLSTGSPFPFEG